MNNEKNNLDRKCFKFHSMENCELNIDCDMLFECEDYLQARRLMYEEKMKEIAGFKGVLVSKKDYYHTIGASL